MSLTKQQHSLGPTDIAPISIGTFIAMNGTRVDAPRTIFHLLGKKITPRFLRSGGAAPLASHEFGRIKARGAGEMKISAKNMAIWGRKAVPRAAFGLFSGLYAIARPPYTAPSLF